MHLQLLQTFKIPKLTEPRQYSTLRHIVQFFNQLRFKEERISSQKNNIQATDSQYMPNDPTLMLPSKNLKCSDKSCGHKDFTPCTEKPNLASAVTCISPGQLDLLQKVTSVFTKSLFNEIPYRFETNMIIWDRNIHLP